MAEKRARQKRYSEDFKLQAAKLIVEGGYTYHQAAQRLGVSDWALRCWVKAFRADGQVSTLRNYKQFRALTQEWIDKAIRLAKMTIDMKKA